MAMVTHIQTSSPSIPSPITVHIKTLHPFAMREKLGIGADHNPYRRCTRTFSFHFSLARSVTLRHQRRFIFSPIRRAKPLALLRKASPTEHLVRFPARSRRLRPILERYALLNVVRVRAERSWGARADGVACFGLLEISHAAINLHIIRRRLLSRAINLFFLLLSSTPSLSQTFTPASVQAVHFPTLFLCYPARSETADGPAMACLSTCVFLQLEDIPVVA